MPHNTDLNTDMRLFWPGTNASIPEGFSRDTDFDELYFRQPSGDAGSTGGSDTHTHSWPHTHTYIPGHSHSFSSAGPMKTEMGAPGLALYVAAGHSHAAVSSATSVNVVTESDVESESATISPPYVKVIVIKPNDTTQKIPESCLVLSDIDISDNYFVLVNGINSDIDINEKYLLGANTDGDGGDTGGSSTHSHTGISHNHSVTHSHADTDGGATSAYIANNPFGFSSMLQDSIHHSIAFSDSTPQNSGTKEVTSDATENSSMPLYIKLAGFEVQSDAFVKHGIIIGYVGTRANIPEGWSAYEGTIDKMAYVVNLMDGVGTTGGNNEHTHSSEHNHGSPLAGHTHTPTETDTGLSVKGLTGNPPPNFLGPKHDHTWTVAQTLLGSSNTNEATFVSSTNNTIPAYRELIFIRREHPTVNIKGAKILGGLIANA